MDKPVVKFDERYGKCLWYDLYDDGETAPVLVAIMDQGGTAWLDIRRMFWRGEQLGFGKGARIELPNDKAEDVLGMAVAAVTAWKDGSLQDVEEQTDEDTE